MRSVLVLVLLLVAFVRGAEALTIRDLIELSRAGLGDDVLIALIEVDRGVYAIDTATLKSLKDAGVGDRVIVALIRSGREQPVREEPPVWDEPALESHEAPPPPVVVIEHRHDEPAVQTVAVPVPVYVAVPGGSKIRRGVRAADHSAESTFVPFQSGPPAVRPEPVQKRGQPVYWGFGGKLRPDAWQPDGHNRTKTERERPSDRERGSEKGRR